MRIDFVSTLQPTTFSVGICALLLRLLPGPPVGSISLPIAPLASFTPNFASVHVTPSISASVLGCTELGTWICCPIELTEMLVIPNRSVSYCQQRDSARLRDCNGARQSSIACLSSFDHVSHSRPRSLPTRANSSSLS